MTKIKRRSWVIIDHPLYFLLACNLSLILSRACGYKSNLLISKHVYWKYLRIGKYRRYFSKIHYFDRFDYPAPHTNIIKQIIYSLLLFPRFFLLKRKLLSLKLGSKDIVFTISGCTFLEDMIVGNFHTFRKIIILPYQNYLSWKGALNSSAYGTNIAIEIAQIIKRIFKMSPTVFKYKKKKNNLGVGDYYLGQKEKFSKIFDSVILTVGAYEGSIRKVRENNVYLAQYPNLVKSVSSRKSTKKKIVFLGTYFLRGEDADPRIFTREINKYLDYLRNLYFGKYELTYKPHPRESSESKLLDLKGFKITNDRKPAEIYFLENRENIKSVFSISSLASQSAHHMGINSYLFFKLFPFTRGKRLVFTDFFSVLPPECLIDSLKTPPKRIKPGGSQSTSSLEKIVGRAVL